MSELATGDILIATEGFQSKYVACDEPPTFVTSANVVTIFVTTNYFGNNFINYNNYGSI